MIDRLVLNIADFFMSRNIITDNNKDMCVYGLSLIIAGVINILVILFAGAVTGNLMLAILFLMVLIPLRMFTGGYHANTHIGCNIVFLGVFLLSVSVLKYLVDNGLDIYSWMAVSLGIFVVSKFAPMENSNKILSEAQKAKYKIISLAIYSIWVIMALILNMISHVEKLSYKEEWRITGLYINIILIIIVGMLIIGRKGMREDVRKNDETGR